mmetsp:Transcript_8013/g.12499  ORF Transcript_8013/g.12499 Transcript_8013/m.12499 type:complete len:88 (+) Transcript_8013:306-569(+)
MKLYERGHYYWTRATTGRGLLDTALPLPPPGDTCWIWIVFSPPCITALPLSGAGTLFAGTPSSPPTNDLEAKCYDDELVLTTLLSTL